MKHNLDIGPKGSKKQFKAEFPKKFWEKLCEEDLQHASLTVSYTILTRHTDKSEARKVKKAG